MSFPGDAESMEAETIGEDVPEIMMSLLSLTDGDDIGVSSSINSESSSGVDFNAVIPTDRANFRRVSHSEAFKCAWNPRRDLLACGGSNHPPRIWNLTQNVKTRTGKPFTLCQDNQGNGTTVQNSTKVDVTTLDWNYDGRLLAASTFDGYVKIWNTEATHLSTIIPRKGLIRHLKWSKGVDTILLSGRDNIAEVWDAGSENCLQKFAFHSGEVLDVAWQSSTTFASCSEDKSIFVCQLGMDKPLRSFVGHTDRVTGIKWNAEGTLLASCSNDAVIKVWSMNHDPYHLNLEDHFDDICSMTWSPTGPSTVNPNMNPILASGSYDSTVKLWDIERGICKTTLIKHTKPVDSVAFSPDGAYLASGSSDNFIHIWSIKDGRLVYSYQCSSGIFDVSWNCKGDKVQGSAFRPSVPDGSIVILDLRYMIK